MVYRKRPGVKQKLARVTGRVVRAAGEKAVKVSRHAAVFPALKGAEIHVGVPAVDGLYVHDEEDLRNETVVLGAVGDSLAAGFGASEADATPSVLMAKDLSQADLAADSDVGQTDTAERHPMLLLNCAQQGASTREVKLQILELKSRRDALVREGKLKGTEPLIVCIQFGANDVRHRLSWAETRDALRDAIDTATSMGAQVLLVTPPPMHAPLPFQRTAIGWLLGRKGKKLSQKIVDFGAKMQAEGYAVTVVPLHEIMDKLPEHAEEWLGAWEWQRFEGIVTDPEKVRKHGNPFHPNDAGYRITIDRFLPHFVAAAKRALARERTHPEQEKYHDGRPRVDVHIAHPTQQSTMPAR